MAKESKEIVFAEQRPHLLLATSLWNLAATYTFLKGSQFITANSIYLSSRSLQLLAALNLGYTISGLLGFRGVISRRTSSLILGIGNLGQTAFEIIASRSKIWDRGELTRYTIGDGIFGILNLISWLEVKDKEYFEADTQAKEEEEDKGHFDVEIVEIEDS